MIDDDANDDANDNNKDDDDDRLGLVFCFPFVWYILSKL